MGSGLTLNIYHVRTLEISKPLYSRGIWSPKRESGYLYHTAGKRSPKRRRLETPLSGEVAVGPWQVTFPFGPRNTHSKDGGTGVPSGCGSHDWGLETILKGPGSRSPGISPSPSHENQAQFSPSQDKKVRCARPFTANTSPWQRPEKSENSEFGRRGLPSRFLNSPGLSLPIGARRGPTRGISKRPPRPDVVGLLPRHHSCSYLGRCARAPGGGQSGGGQGTGAAPCFLAPLRRSRRREEPVPVCAGELLASGPQGWRPTPWSGPASGGPAWARAQTSLPPPSLSARSADRRLGLAGRAWAAPARSPGAWTD